MMRTLVLAALCLTGCQYDYDKLYEHASLDDGGVSDTSMPVITSTALISKWIGSQQPISQECVSCAEQKCAAEDQACVGDPVCVQYTECVGKDPSPAGMAACREQFSKWVNSDPVRDRDLNGPYGQCVFRYKCTAECTGDQELWCAGKYSLPLTSDQTVPMHLYLIDAFDQSPVANADVRICSAQSVQCADGTAAVKTDANGFVNLQLPSSFSRAFTGYLEITGAGRYPTLLKFSWNIGQETTQVVSVVAEASFKAAISSVFLNIDSTRGMLQLRMLGCSGAGVKGVHFTSSPADPKSRTWYIVNGVPKLDATETTPVGSGGIIDVPEGTINVSARTADNTVVASADAPVRANFMSVVIYAPSGR